MYLRIQEDCYVETFTIRNHHVAVVTPNTCTCLLCLAVYMKHPCVDNIAAYLLTCSILPHANFSLHICSMFLSFCPKFYQVFIFQEEQHFLKIVFSV